VSVNIRVLVGTETGNAEECAFELETALGDAGYDVTVTDMEEYTPSSLKNETMAVIVTSTYGNGDPPHNAEAVMNWLKQTDVSIRGVSFAVCGLGDVIYPYFAQAGKDFDRLMEERGGTRVIKRQDCDVDYEETFEQFSNKLINWLDENADTLSAPSAAAQEEEIVVVDTNKPPGTRTNPVSATLSKRKRLNKEGSQKETMHYEFIWPGVEVDFSAGDSFAVVPENNGNEVDLILSALNLDGEQEVTIGSETFSLRDALTHHRDLQTVTDDLFYLLAGDGADVPDGSGNLEEYLDTRHLVDVLEDCPGGSPDAQAFVSELKKMKPRLYSVASSPKVDKEGVHFTVETLRYDRHGRDCEGVATTWFADRVNDGDAVSMYVVPAAHFRLPKSKSTPIIMVGPGTGVAPFRAFLRERAAVSLKSKNWLFFGHQHEKTDFLYEDEMKAALEEGILDELSLAWSRDQEEKVYVQDLIREQSHELWKWIRHGAYVYVCGDKRAMAPQVREAFAHVLVTHGGFTESDAMHRISEWEKDGRYCVDAY